MDTEADDTPDMFAPTPKAALVELTPPAMGRLFYARLRHCGCPTSFASCVASDEAAAVKKFQANWPGAEVAFTDIQDADCTAV